MLGGIDIMSYRPPVVEPIGIVPRARCARPGRWRPSIVIISWHARRGIAEASESRDQAT